MQDMIGHIIAHYEILSLLGEGGMGIVYKGRDIRLNRFVAIKILPADKVADPERKRRFTQEAQAASALNHPNIITIHDIDSENGNDFMVMEVVLGKMLSQLIPTVGQKLDEALKYAVQIADGLAAAHGVGIIHRDLKPGNVMVTESGHVKILDFGLAKLTEISPNEKEETRTLAPETEQGTILGTIAYMSPEQAQGKKVDARSDIFSFGAMFYEMVTGHRPFRGDSKISILAAILREEPRPPGMLANTVPRELERIILRCLRKDPARRFQTMADLRVALQELLEELESGKLLETAPVPIKHTPKLLRWVAMAASLVIGSSVGVFWAIRQSPPKKENWSFSRLTSDSGLTTTPAISYDGKFVVYASDRAGAGNLDLYVQQVSGGRPLRLTEHPADDSAPSFSSDGSQIVFRSERDGGGIYTIPALGGEARLIAAKGFNPKFAPDGKTIAFQFGSILRASEIFLVPTAGGRPSKLRTNVPWAANPTWSPDGRIILFAGSQRARNADALYTVPVQGGEARKVLELSVAFSSYDIQWLAGGRLLYGIRNYTGATSPMRGLWTLKISSDGRILGSSERFTMGAGDEQNPSADATGNHVVFAGLQTNQDIWTIAINGSKGKPEGEMLRLTTGPADSTYPTVSRDGRHLAYTSDRSGNWDLYVRNMETGKERALTSAPEIARRAEISPDGTRVAYAGPHFISVVSTRGGVPEKVCEQCTHGTVFGWTPDGRHLIGGRDTPASLVLIDTQNGKQTTALHHQEWDLHRGQVSPEGRWIAFNPKMGPTKSAIFISPFRNGIGADQKDWIRVTDGEGNDSSPMWSPDENLLYFITGRNEFQDLWAIFLNPETKQPAGEPFEVLTFHTARRPLQSAFGKAVTRDKLFWGMQEYTGNIWVAQRMP